MAGTIPHIMLGSTEITCCAVHSDYTMSSMSYAFCQGNSQPIMALIILPLFTECLQLILVASDGIIAHSTFVISGSYVGTPIIREL